MAVQDDAREQELCNLFNLEWDPDHARDGVDAWFEATVDGIAHRVPVEVKSTTTDSVSTARDVGLSHIHRWRSKFWVIGFYASKGGLPRIGHCLCLTPSEMKPWIDQIENYVMPDFRISEEAAKHLTLDDLYLVCGEKAEYDLKDAQALYKRQWQKAQYIEAMDLENGYSPLRMLEILRSRLRYIADRGSTLNNPTSLRDFFPNSALNGY